MRYYDLRVFKPQQGTKNGVEHLKDTSGLRIGSYMKRKPGGYGWEVGGPNDEFHPNALEIEFQINETSIDSFDSPSGNASITIHGVDMHRIKTASRLVGSTVVLKAGMGKGLPLSNPNQTGEILHGTVLTAVGNWVGVAMDLTLYLSNHVIPPQDITFPTVEGVAKQIDSSKPRNTHYPFHCLRGQDLRQAMKLSLQRINPDYDTEFNVKDPIPAPEDLYGSYPNFTELCAAMSEFWHQATKKRLRIYPHGTVFSCYEDGRAEVTHDILFEELIGQPSWDGVANISFTTAMRGDLKVGDVIRLPLSDTPTPSGYGVISATGTEAIGLQRNRVLFSGTYLITGISHLGQFRSPDGQQWASTFFCVPA